MNTTQRTIFNPATTTTPLHASRLMLPLLFFSFCIVFIVFDAEPEYRSVYLQLTLLVALCSMGPLLNWAKGPFDIFEPINILSIAYFIYFALRGFYFVELETEEAISAKLIRVTPVLLKEGLVTTSLGLVGMNLGYWWARSWKWKIPFQLECEWKGASKGAIYFLFALGLIASTGAYSNWLIESSLRDWLTQYGLADLLTQISFFTSYALGIALLMSTDLEQAQPQIGSPVVKGLLCLTVLLGLWLVQKEIFIVTGLTVLIVSHYSKKTLHLTRLSMSLLVLAILVFPIVQGFRNMQYTHYAAETGRFSDKLKSYLLLPEYLKNYNLTTGAIRIDPFRIDEFPKEVLDSISERFHGLDSVMVTLAQTPALLPYLHGTTLGSIFYNFIPRALWPDKPTIGLSRFFSYTYWGHSPDSARPVSMAITHVGELFMNFGKWGVLGGMFLLGIFYQSMYRWFLQNQNKSGIFIYTFLLVSVLTVERDISFTFGTLIKRLPFLLLILYFINNKHLWKRKGT